MSRKVVYEALKEKQDGFVSGEELSESLGITRAAVWKAVQGLRRDGYEIEARTGLGYRLVREADRLEDKKIREALPAGRDRIHLYEEIDSTNTECKRLAAEGAPDGTVAVADHQSAGKGRLGRSFQSPSGQGLYLSILWRPECEPAKLLPLTALCAVATARAIASQTGVRPGIKWPNDLVYGGRKLVGILTEMSLEGDTGHIDYVIAGIGINCHQKEEDFEGEVAKIAGSLDTTMGGTVSRSALAGALIRELDLLCSEILNRPDLWLEEYRELCVSTGKQVQVIRGNDRRMAQALEIDETFGLTVRYEDGMVETLRSGEVSVRGLYGYI